MAAVDKALKNGSLNGKEHSKEEIAELKRSGVYKERYSQFIQMPMWDSEVCLDAFVGAWKEKFANEVCSKCSRKLALHGFEAAFALQKTRICDILDVQDHNIKLRPKPGSRHDLQRWRSSRGAHVEVFHGPSKHFANLDSNWRLFQALQMEGIARYNAERREENLQAVGPDGDESARAATRVPHFLPWLHRERNRLSQAVGRASVPYPHESTERPKDNGERFLMEYAFEQADRKKNVLSWPDTPRPSVTSSLHVAAHALHAY